MRFRKKLLSVVGGAALVAAALAVANSPTSSSAAARQPSGENPAPAAQVKGVAKALGISEQQARTRLVQQQDAHETYKRLPKELVTKLAGHWFDAKTGKLTVAVTSKSLAAEAEKAGAEAKVVDRSKAELDKLVAAVRKAASTKTPGLNSYGVDVRTNGVTVTVNRDKKDAATERFLARVRKLDGVTVVETEGSLAQQVDIRGGDGWNRGQTDNNCSVGFSATGTGGSKHFVTAGHCTTGGPSTYLEVGQKLFGKVGGSVNAAEGDLGKVDVTEAGFDIKPEVSTWGTGSNIVVSGSGETMVGEAVCHSGRTSPYWECGKVTKLNVTASYGVQGLTATTTCSQGGDSGGSWLSGTKAFGVHSGGYNDCPGTRDEQSLFQPVNEVLQKWNLTLLTGGTSDTQAPPAPGNLRSTGKTSNSVSLAWDASTDNVGVTGYDVYNGSSLATTVTGTSASIGGLTADTSYTFTVKAKDAAGNASAASSPVTVRTDPGDPGGDDEPPTTPGNLKSTGTTATTVSLSWEASVDNVGVTGYDVFKNGTLATTSTTTSATVSGLTANTTYSFTVQAKDAAGNKSKPTTALSVKTSTDGDVQRTFTNETDYPIRDFTLTTSTVSSTATGAAANPVTVKITASHTCQQDLQIGVRSPTGRYYQLQAYGGDGWNCTPFPGTRTFTFVPVSEQAAGTWQLRIGDNGPGDIGTLSSWSITL